MTKHLSFTKFEHKVLPKFRRSIGHAESTEDLKKFFVYTSKDLLESILGEKTVRYEDVAFTPDNEPFFTVDERLMESADFKALWANSDLPSLIGQLAVSTLHHYRHLETHPEKTDSKIRMTSGRGGANRQ